MVNHTILRLLHRISITTPIKSINHKRHVPSAILLLLWVLLNVFELHFDEPISILTFTINPNGAWVDLRSGGLSWRHEFALNLNHITTCYLTAIHLLLLGKCHDLAHWHLKL